MTAAVMFSTPNHKMVASHHYMGGDFTPSRLNDSFLQKVICSTPNFAPSTPITPSSVAHTTSVSKYVNMGTIGEGSYGLVLKCKERQTGRIVAIKKFIESEEDKSVRKIAMREIHLLKQLRHENLVNLLEVFRRKSRLYLVFEFVEKSLLDHLELSPNGLERGHCRRILYQVIRALEFCHIHNIIHRDVKPENILISKHGVVKLCDFGFARTLAKPGEIYTEYVSTRWYRAPELLVGDARYGRAVDIWALGCLSAEMMTGQPLFPGDSDIDQLFSIVKCFGGLCTRHEDRLYSNPMFRFEISQIEVTEPLKCRIRGCSSREFQFVASCLELDPQDRPTCSALLRHPLFTCDGFTSWFPDELEEMLRRDADEHKLPTEAPKPKRLLPDLKKCILLNSSTPIKGSSAHPVNLFAQPTNHHQPPNSYNDCPQEKVATTHRNLEKAFGNCVANDDHDDDDDVKSPHNDSGHDDDERFNFDLRPQDTYDLQLPDSSAISDLDLSFSHLGIREGVELEGEESPRKLMNINEDCGDDYEEDANGIYNYAHHDDDVYDNSNKQHPVSVQPINHKDDYNKNNDYNNNNNKNNYNNNNNGKQLSSSKIKSLSSSSSSSSSAMTSLPSSSSSSASSKSSASTSGVSSPSSSSSSSTSSLNNNNHHHYQQHNNYHYNKNNYSPINNNNNYNNNNYYYYNHNKTGANNNNSSNTNNVQSHKSTFDANHKSQNQKFPQHSTSKNYKSQQQDQTRTQHKPLQPLQQKNNNQQNNQQQQQYNQQQKNNIHKQQQQQHHYKQTENESPKPVQRSTQQQQHKQQQQQKFQHPQKQQNFQSKPAKKKSNIDASKPTQKQTAPKFSTNQTAPKFSTNQSKIGFKHS